MSSMLVVVSEVDPVAPRVAERWGTLPSTGAFVDGAAIRRFPSGALLLRRPGRHIVDEHLDDRLPPEIRETRPTLVFPSVHRSAQARACLTVHPVGNLGPAAERGGSPEAVVPADPARMAAALRRLAERAAAIGLPATFEATHHGPLLGLPALFVEIGFEPLPAPPTEAVALLAEIVPAIEPEPGDRVAVAVGGGHYAPHFTELVLERRWAIGHIASRHSLAVVRRATMEAAVAATPGAEGLLFARAADAGLPSVAGLAARLRDGDAAPRARGRPEPTPSDRSTSGT